MHLGKTGTTRIFKIAPKWTPKLFQFVYSGLRQHVSCSIVNVNISLCILCLVYDWYNWFRDVSKLIIYYVDSANSFLSVLFWEIMANCCSLSTAASKHSSYPSSWKACLIHGWPTANKLILGVHDYWLKGYSVWNPVSKALEVIEQEDIRS